jgi:hypothetical protein
LRFKYLHEESGDYRRVQFVQKNTPALPSLLTVDSNRN